MRALAVILAAICGAGAGACVRGAFAARRPRDLAYALAAPALVVGAVTGLVMALSP